MTFTTAVDRVEVAGAPAISGLTFRRLRDDRDYDSIAALITTANLADGIDWAPDGPNLKAEYEHNAHMDVRSDVVLAEVEGRLVAIRDTFREVRDDTAIYGSIGHVHPEFRRRGLGRALLRHGEARLREIAATHPEDTKREYGSWIGDREGGAKELLESEGYRAVRFGFEMERSLRDPLPTSPLPEGLAIRPVEKSTLRTIFQAENEAFRDHWGHVEQTDEDFDALLASPDLDLGLWRVAWDGDDVAGVVHTTIWKRENETLGVKRGWLERVSVRRPWRRRGLAAALIVSAFEALRAAGMDEAFLGVDAENTSGALHLYESLGFRVRDRGTTYRKAW
ncbi:MAG TPA: GNAT family N-acetyltransferase [Candidatus Limnocylindrales bacterium]|nr:GNAT family N-acetyltransferase [Candidatus Limnocylindrales bacterium]